MMICVRGLLLVGGVYLAVVGCASAQGGSAPPGAPPAPVSPGPGTSAASGAAPGTALPEDYVIGTDDVLSVVFWRDKDMSADVVVRPDGKITLPLLNEIVASGLTPEQLRARVTEAASRFLEEPAASVIVREARSRRVFITGEVAKPGIYPLTAPTTVLQLIAIAGGLNEYAKKDAIVIERIENGKAQTFQFDYSAVGKKKKGQQNLLLKPGDTVVVP